MINTSSEIFPADCVDIIGYRLSACLSVSIYLLYLRLYKQNQEEKTLYFGHCATKTIQNSDHKSFQKTEKKYAEFSTIQDYHDK